MKPNPSYKSAKYELAKLWYGKPFKDKSPKRFNDTDKYPKRFNEFPTEEVLNNSNLFNEWIKKHEIPPLKKITFKTNESNH